MDGGPWDQLVVYCRGNLFVFGLTYLLNLTSMLHDIEGLPFLQVVLMAVGAALMFPLMSSLVEFESLIKFLPVLERKCGFWWPLLVWSHEVW